MKKTTSILRNITCPCPRQRKFKKKVDIVEGSQSQSTTLNVYCPHCGKWMDVSIDGDTMEDTTMRGD